MTTLLTLLAALLLGLGVGLVAADVVAAVRTAAEIRERAGRSATVVVTGPGGHLTDAFVFRPRGALGPPVAVPLETPPIGPAFRTSARGGSATHVAPGAPCWVCGRPESEGEHDH